MTPTCDHCPAPAFTTRPGTLPMARVVGLDGRVILPATRAIPDAHWCRACAPWARAVPAERHGIEAPR